MQKILIIQTAYIGDVILATSLIQKIKALDTTIQIDFLLRKGNESVLENDKEIKNIFIWDKKKKYRSMFQIIKQLRQENYDAVLNIQRFLNSGIFTICSKAKVKIGFDKNPLSILFHHKIKHMIPYPHKKFRYLHEVQRNSLLIQPLFENYKLEAAHSLPLKLSISENDKKKVQTVTRNRGNYIVIAPASVWFTKQYSREQWVEFINLVPKEIHIFFIGAPSDKNFIDEVISDKKQMINLAGELTLIQSARLMQKALRVFVNDSAPLHLASAVNAKITALFCSTVPRFGYSPLADDAVVLQERQNLACRPCGLHGKKECPLEHFNCSKLISAQDLLKTIDTSKC